MMPDGSACFGPRMLSWTSQYLSSHKLAVVLIASVLVLLSGVDLANWNLPKAQNDASMKPFLFVLITACVFVAAFWIVSASSFERSIKEPLIAIINAGNSNGKKELTNLLCHYCLMVDLPLTPSDFASWAIGDKPSAVDYCDKVLVACRIVYVCLWSCLSLYLWMLLATYSCPQFSKSLLIASIILLCYLNCCSYYVCWSHVWLLKQLAKRPCAQQISHISLCPVASPVYRTLSNVSRLHSAVFLAVSLICSFSLFIWIKIILVTSGSIGFCIQFILIVIISVGIGTGSIICISSRFFLSRLLFIWREDSLGVLPSQLIPSVYDIYFELYKGDGSVIDYVRMQDTANASDLVNSITGLLSVAINCVNIWLLVTSGG